MPVPARDPEALYEAAIAEPRRVLEDIGIKLPAPRFSGNPLLWRYMPLSVLVRTLIDHGLLQKETVYQPNGVMRGPGWWWWRFYRPHQQAARDALYDWVRGEWARYGQVMAESRKWLDIELQRPAPPPEWLHALRSLVKIRNVLASFAGVALDTGCPGCAEPQAAPYPDLVDYVFALDQALDRFRDIFRGLLLDRLVNGEECSEVVRAEAVALLQRDYDQGLWPTAVDDLEAVCARISA